MKLCIDTQMLWSTGRQSIRHKRPSSVWQIASQRPRNLKSARRSRRHFEDPSLIAIPLKANAEATYAIRTHTIPQGERTSVSISLNRLSLARFGSESTPGGV